MSDPNLPIPPQGDEYLKRLNLQLTSYLRRLSNEVTSIASGYAWARKNTGTTAPTTGKWNKGDRIWNSSPSELGAHNNKYVIEGWICVAEGEPGTWVEMRCLTGN